MERPRKAKTHVSGTRNKIRCHQQQQRNCDAARGPTTHEGYCAQCLLHEDLSNRRQVVMRVVGHHNTGKQNGHYSCDCREPTIKRLL